MKNKKAFLSTSELGDLFIFDVLLTYIYPRVFVCEDIYDTKYLFYEMESLDNLDTWLVCKIRKQDYYDLVDKKKPIQSIYKKSSKNNLYSISNLYGDNDIVTVSNNTKSLIELLPIEDVYSEKETVDDIAEETLIAARESGNTTFDIRLFSGTDRHDIAANILIELSKYLTALTGSVFGNKRSESLRVSTTFGSCVVRYSFPDQINLLNENSPINEMETLNRIFVSEDIEEDLKLVKNKPGFITAYSGFLNAIKKAGSDVQFTTANPNSKIVNKVELSKEKIRKKYIAVSTLYDTKLETIKKKGRLVGFDIKTLKFKLDVTDTIISGTIDESFDFKKSYALPETYEATLDFIRYYDKNDVTKKEQYCLKELKEVN